MVSSRTGRIVRALIVMFIALAGLLSVRQHAHADDEATKIYQLARSLHYEDRDRGVFTVWVNGDIGEDTSARRTAVNGGDPLPDFKFNLLAGDGTLQPKDIQGPYILNFWASWCTSCRTEFPLFSAKIKDKSLAVPVIFVDVLDFKPDAERFLLSLDPGTKLTAAIDPQSALYSAMWFTVMPNTVLVDARGNVQAIQVGEMSDLALSFFAEIATHPGVGSFDRLRPDAQPASAAATPDLAATP